MLIDGQPVFENPEVKKRIAYIPDDVFYFAQSNVRELARFYQGMYPAFDRERFERLRDVFGIDDKKPIRKLSKGMQKQAAFWVALSQMPEVVILDEPVDGLDPVMRRQVWSLLMSDVAERGTTVLVSSHNLRELEDVCDYVGIMDKGKMLIERELADLQQNIVKIQIAYPEGKGLPEGLNIIHASSTGRLQQLILRGSSDELEQKLSASAPLFMDFLPLSLEEIFIYELGGVHSEIKNIIL